MKFTFFTTFKCAVHGAKFSHNEVQLSPAPVPRTFSCPQEMLTPHPRPPAPGSHPSSLRLCESDSPRTSLSGVTRGLTPCGRDTQGSEGPRAAARLREPCVRTSPGFISAKSLITQKPPLQVTFAILFWSLKNPPQGSHALQGAKGQPHGPLTEALAQNSADCTGTGLGLDQAGFLAAAPSPHPGSALSLHPALRPIEVPLCTSHSETKEAV